MLDCDNAPLICYGDDGPAFVKLCPQCRRIMKWPGTIRWQEDWIGVCKFQTIDCDRCGPVEPEHVGWSGDFR